MFPSIITTTQITGWTFWLPVLRWLDSCLGEGPSAFDEDVHQPDLNADVDIIRLNGSYHSVEALEEIRDCVVRAKRLEFLCKTFPVCVGLRTKTNTYCVTYVIVSHNVSTVSKIAGRTGIPLWNIGTNLKGITTFLMIKKQVETKQFS